MRESIASPRFSVGIWFAVLLLAQAFFCILAAMYYSDVAVPYVEGARVWFDKWTVAFNYPDFEVYFDVMRKVQEGTVSLGDGINNIGIAYLYYGLSELLGLDIELPTIVAFAFWINLILIFGSGVLFMGLLRQRGGSLWWLLMFFVSPYLLFFSQLINKDIWTIFLLLLSVRLLERRNVFLLLLFLPVLMLVRLQYAMVWALMIYLRFGFGSMTQRAIVAYLLSCAVSVAASIRGDLFDFSGQAGLSALIHDLNVNYYAGALLLYPARAMAYVLSYFFAWGQIFENGLGNVLFLVYALCSILWLIVLPGLVRVLLRGKEEWQSMGPLLIVLYAYVLMMLASPIAELRYLTVAFPLIFLMAAGGRFMPNVRKSTILAV